MSILGKLFGLEEGPDESKSDNGHPSDWFIKVSTNPPSEIVTYGDDEDDPSLA